MALGSLLLQPCHPEGLDGELPASASFSPLKGQATLLSPVSPQSFNLQGILRRMEKICTFQSIRDITWHKIN